MADNIVVTDNTDDFKVPENQSSCGVFADTVSAVGHVRGISDADGIYFKLIYKIQLAGGLPAS